MSAEIRIIKRSALNVEKWNALIASSDASVYNQVYYLDTLAEHWSAVIYGDYEGGIAIPYTIRLGVKGIYTPNFLRAVDWMGISPESFKPVEELLKRNFTRAQLQINQSIFDENEQLVYQEIKSNAQLQLGSQSKRSIKKFEKSGLKIETIRMEEALPLIVGELKSKVKGLRQIDFLRFNNLLLNYDLSSCFCFGVKGEKLHAASIIIEWKNQWLYIKGGVDEFGKQNGIMHALMHDSMLRAFEKGKEFSFEGSKVESIRQFNHGFGASDVNYYVWKWNHSPWWFRILLTLRK